MGFTPRTLSAPTLSLAVHAGLVLAIGGVTLAKPRYGVEPGLGGVELRLVAAPKKPPRRSVISPLDSRTARDSLVVKESTPAESAAKPGNESIPSTSGAGALASNGPAYLRNPAPAYPERARALGQEGTVVLAVAVSSSGKVKELKVKTSSGFPLLDEAAIRAVRNWVFESAAFAGAVIAAEVDIPLRFRLVR